MDIKYAYIGQKVEGGRPYSEDYDQGKIVALVEGGEASVAWQSGVTTPTSVRSLRDGWSGRFADWDGWTLVLERTNSDAVAVLRNGDGELMAIGGDAMGRGAWAVDITSAVQS